jgi:uncharacterized membrane protein
MSTTSLICLTILGWGIGSLFYKVANDNMHPMMISVLITGVYLVLDAVALAFIPFDKTINSPGLLFTILGAIFMCVGSLAYFYALKGGGSAGATTVLISLYPALTVILSAFFLKETFTVKHGIGIALALASFVFMSSK